MNLHPGALAAIARLTADELGIARMMAAGDLVSPQIYHNLALYNMRVTGTGLSYRGTLDEFVYRRPENYLTPDFLARIAGLPVIWIHPKKNLLNSKEFGNRVVGAVMLPFIRDDEVWAVCRIYDDSAIAEMGAEQMSTSPAVLLDKSTKITTDSGDKLLIEENPVLIDHLAIVSKGVWDKGAEPTGIEHINAGARGDSSMADKTEEEKKADAAKADAARADADKSMNEKMDAILKGVGDAAVKVDACMKRMDAWEGKEREREDKAKKDAAEHERKDRKDGEEDMADKAKKDGEDEEEREKAKRLAADKAKKDAADEEDRKKADASRADASSGLEARLASQQAMIDKLMANAPRDISDAEFGRLAEIQSHADEALIQHGKRAGRPMLGETVIGYRRRMSNELKRYSPKWKDLPLEGIRDDAFEAQIEGQIYADAAEAAKHPTDLADGELRCVPGKTLSGHIENKYYGNPRDWMDPIAGPVRQYVRNFKERT